MAARSTGIFPREGFNLDNSFAIFAVSTVTPVNLANVRSFRVVIVNAAEVAATGDGGAGTFSYEIGGEVFSFTIDEFLAKLDANGTYIAHHRGFGLTSPTESVYTITDGADNTGTGQSLTFDFIAVELVDSPAR
jgi:hypothetical protein